MKRFTLLFILLFLVSILFANCKKGGKQPVEETTKKAEKEAKVSETEDILLTENEVKSFIKAYPVFVETAKKEGEKFEGAEKNVLKSIRAGRQAVKSVEKINKALKPYGFDMESFMTTYGKVMTAYSYMMMGDLDKFYEENIKRMKESLKNPNIPAESKEEFRKNIKEMEEQKNSEETKAYKKNIEILKKYKDQLRSLFE